MKPLTIDELKALEVGDWAYIIRFGYGYYCCKQDATNNAFVYKRGSQSDALSYENYVDIDKGIMSWLAYKNKEQAEATGEIVELPCKVGDTVWILDDPYFVADIFQMEVQQINITHSHIIMLGYHECELCEFISQFVFKTKEEAERRLAELKGEKE